MRWKVDLYGIQWDDGKGEYDVSDLPVDVQVFVSGDTREEAILFAMQDASDAFGSLIASTREIQARLQGH